MKFNKLLNVLHSLFWTFTFLTISTPSIAQTVIANDDFIEVMIHEPIVFFDVLENDEGEDLVIVDVCEPQFGTAYIDSANVVIYESNEEEIIMPDEFCYIVCGNNNVCDTALIVIEPIDQGATHLEDDYVAVPANNSIHINILANDHIPTDGPIFAHIVDEPENGVVAIEGNGSPSQQDIEAHYIPNENFIGNDAFSYSICDDETDCLAWVYLSVHTDSIGEGNLHLFEDYYDVTYVVPMNEDTSSIILTPLGNDIGDDLVLVDVCEPVYGTVDIAANGLLFYTPFVDTMETAVIDEFCYIACDANGFCDTALIAIEVTYTYDNQTIFAHDDFAQTIVNESVEIFVFDNDYHIEEEIFEIATLETPEIGEIAYDPTIGLVIYTPEPDFIGGLVVHYSICTDNNECDEAMIHIEVTPDWEEQDVVAYDDYIYTSEFVEEGDSLLIEPLQNDIGSGLQLIDVCPANFGSVDIQNNILVYLPSGTHTPNNPLSDEFCYIVCSDSTNVCDTAFVFINGEPIGNEFSINDDEVTTFATDPVDIPVLLNDWHLENLNLLITDFTIPDNGQVDLLPDGVFIYTADQNFTGVDTFSYTACTSDSLCGTATVYVTVLHVDPAYVVNDDYVPIAPNQTSVTFNVLDNDYGTEEFGFVVMEVCSPAFGTATIDSEETITYTVNDSSFVHDEFCYIICSNDPTIFIPCDTAFVYISVETIDDSTHLFIPDVYENIAVNASIEVNIFEQLGAAYNDEDNYTIEVLTVSPFESFITITDSTGTIEYQPVAAFEGEGLITYEVCNLNTGECFIGSIYIQVGEALCEGDCVWPGDTDRSGVANNFDILSIGLAYEEQGFERPFATIEWEGQTAMDWQIDLPELDFSSDVPGDSITVDAKHADCNGDGVINFEDVTAIEQNYGRVHGKTSLTAEEDAPFLRFDIPESIEAHSWVAVDVILGSDDLPINDIHGVAFSVEYNTDIIDPGSFSITFDNSWLNEGNNISVKKDYFESGRIEVGSSRIDRQNVSGYGKVATAYFFVIDNIDGKTGGELELTLTPVDAVVVSNEGKVEILNTEPATTSVIITGIGEKPQDELTTLTLYPNPTRAELNIQVADMSPKNIAIYNVLGQVVETITPNPYQSQYKVNVQDYYSGVYIVSITTEKGIISKSVQVVK